MELKLEIGFDELLSAVKQLPEDQLEILKQALSKKQETPVANKSFKDFLLSGPVMTDDHYEAFKETRKSINKWRSK